MKKIILNPKSAKIDSDHRLFLLETNLSVFQKLFTHFKKLDLGFDLKDISELIELINDPENYIKKRIAETVQIPTIYGKWKQKKNAFVDTLELPDFTELSKLAKECKLLWRDFKFYMIDSAKIVLNKKEVDTIKDSCILYARTPEQEQLAVAHKEALEALNKLNIAFFKSTGSIISDVNLFSDFFGIANNFPATTDNIVINESFYNEIQERFREVEEKAGK